MNVLNEKGLKDEKDEKNKKDDEKNKFFYTSTNPGKTQSRIKNTNVCNYFDTTKSVFSGSIKYKI